MRRDRSQIGRARTIPQIPQSQTIMNQAATVILCLAYIIGLLSTKIAPGGYVVLAVGVVLAILLPQLKRSLLRQSHKNRKSVAQKPKTQNKTSKLKTKKQTPEAEKISLSTVPAGVALNKDRIQEKRKTPNLILFSKWLWLSAGFIGLLASFYLQTRIPQPAANDISTLIQADGRTSAQVITVRGKVLTTPRKTRAERSQFWLKATQVSEIVGTDGGADVHREVTGKLYVTAPLLQANGVYPNQWVAVTGILYKPKPASNPGTFDFQSYLAKQGAFAAFKGRQLSFNSLESSKTWGAWKLRRRIVRSHIDRLGVPKGPLVSAMVLGRRAVDLPYELRDRFIQVGLAHVLAASGFHVALILGVILFAANGLPGGVRFCLGFLTLIIYISLTGFSPSVLRAAFMGFAALIAIASDRQVKPLGSLMVAATLLLLINPLWIDDLGFQLSFLATLGLLVTVSPLLKMLDWLPSPLASLIAVPIAASVWTLPLLLYISHVVSPYSIATNIITAPFIAIIALGGFISAIVALILPTVGSAIASVLDYPVRGLIAIVEFFSDLPGNQVAVGSISIFQVVTLYSIIISIWLWGLMRTPKKKKRKRFYLHPLPFAIAIAIAIVIAPAWSTKVSLFQVTVLDTSGEPVLTIQDQGEVTLVNSGDENAAKFVVLPFLRQQGVDRVDWAIATHSQKGLSRGWPTILERLRIKTFYDTVSDEQTYQTSDRSILSAVQTNKAIYQPWGTGQVLQLASTKLELLDPEAPVLQFQIHGQSWLLMGETGSAEQTRLLTSGSFRKTEVLWWSGNRLNVELLNVIRPSVAIASSNSIDPKTANLLREKNIRIFWTGRDGAIQWTPTDGFETTLEADKIDSSVL